MDDLSPGWDAMDAALKALHGAQEPLHWGTVVGYRLGGPDPLDGISAYRVATPDHWHLVTFGMSELYEKESENPAVSGWGFEFTLRLARHGEASPGPWALNFLNNLARYVYDSGNVFAAGHHLDLNGPIALGEETAIRAIAFVEDPQLGALQTPNGHLQFLQIVGLTLDELDAVRSWDARALLGVLRARDPLLVTDLRRRSFLEAPEVAAAVEEGRRRDGSSQGVTFVSHVEWTAGDTAALTLGATAVRELLRLLPHRLPFDRGFTLAGRGQALVIEPGAPAWRADGQSLVISWPAADCAGLVGGLKAARGTYRWPALPGLELTVIPSQIKDGQGNVVETIG